jgi:hypothetical protein
MFTDKTRAKQQDTCNCLLAVCKQNKQYNTAESDWF